MTGSKSGGKAGGAVATDGIEEEEGRFVATVHVCFWQWLARSAELGTPRTPTSCCDRELSCCAIVSPSPPSPSSLHPPSFPVRAPTLSSLHHQYPLCL